MLSIHRRERFVRPSFLDMDRRFFSPFCGGFDLVDILEFVADIELYSFCRNTELSGEVAEGVVEAAFFVDQVNIVPS